MASAPPHRSTLAGVLRGALAQAWPIGAALAGGWLCDRAGVAAPWLTGSMIATIVLGALRLAPPMVPTLRDLAMLLAGTTMGASVTPEAVSAIATFPVSLALLALGMITILASSTVILVRFCGWPLRDAFFASAPGSLTAVLIIAASVRANVARIALLQTCRIFVLVMILPTAITAVENAAPPPSAVPVNMGAGALAVVFAAAFAGSWLFERLRIAGPMIMGAMAASALLTGTGTVTGAMPQPIVILGFVLVGVFIGQRFRAVNAAELVRILPATALSVTTALTVAAAFAWLVTMIVDVEFGPAAIAFAPGGLEAMTVLAVALGLDPLYVSVHHLFRFVFVAVLVPFVIRMRPEIARADAD
ncbi:AbrB family transcriptional regulator [Alsobacter sp. R-9]